MTSKIEQYVEKCFEYLDSDLKEDDDWSLSDELDKLWKSMSDDERELAQKEIADIVNARSKDDQ